MTTVDFLQDFNRARRVCERAMLQVFQYGHLVRTHVLSSALKTCQPLAPNPASKYVLRLWAGCTTIVMPVEYPLDWDTVAATYSLWVSKAIDTLSIGYVGALYIDCSSPVDRNYRWTYSRAFCTPQEAVSEIASMRSNRESHDSEVIRVGYIECGKFHATIFLDKYVHEA